MREHPSAWDTKDENRCMTRTVGRNSCFLMVMTIGPSASRGHTDSREEKIDHDANDKDSGSAAGNKTGA